MHPLSFVVTIKEPFSAISHLIGALCATIVCTALLVLAITQGSALHVFAFMVFGTGMILVYVASTVYHWVPVYGAGEKLLRDLDLSAIYLMIAGSYTPVCLIATPGIYAGAILAVVWLLAAAGIGALWWRRWRGRAQQSVSSSSEWWTAAIYLAMGWLGVLLIRDLYQALPGMAVFWLVAGGVSYSLGALCYAMKWPNPRPRVVEHHEIFHLFVMAGTTCHSWLMIRYIVPLPA